MLHSNYNVLTISDKLENEYSIGDTYKSKTNNWREAKFDGLAIKNIDYCFGVRLHFDINEWRLNPVKIKNR